MNNTICKYDAFLSHSHENAEWAENFAKRLEDECNFKIWLDKWVMVPGKGWIQEIEKGLEGADICLICIGSKTPEGWFKQEIEFALNLQAERPEFRVLPILLPDAEPSVISGFLKIKHRADFRKNKNEAYAFHVVMQGIKNLPVGRWPLKSEVPVDKLASYKKQISELHKFSDVGVHDEVIIEYERKILDRWLEESDKR